MIGFVSLVGAGTLLLGVHPATGPVAAGLFLWWAATSILNAHWLAILQVKVGLELQGVLGLRYRPLHHLEDSLPDVVAGPEIAEDLDELQAEIDARLAPDRREWPSGAGTMAR
jgi:hypothetical protein